MFPSPQGTIF